MTDLVERLVPDEWWVLFRRVVPPMEGKRPQGGGRRRADDREALAAIVFLTTSGCTWRPLEEHGPAVVELGYRLNQAAWGRGYATEGSRAPIHKGFTDLEVERVTANTMTRQHSFPSCHGEVGPVLRPELHRGPAGAA